MVTSESLETRFADMVAGELWSDNQPDSRLLIAEDGSIAAYYAPFEYINSSARIVIVGLTPGRHQMSLALNHLRVSLRSGESWPVATRAAKHAASFGGPMRSNLVAMLDFVGLDFWLGLPSCSSLFSSDEQLVHHTSVLRYPVFSKGQNYSGQPGLLVTPFLQAQLTTWFVAELPALKTAVFVPLGGIAESVLLHLAEAGHLDRTRIISGLPHPSGANAERISYFLRRKPTSSLSRQTNADIIDRNRARIESQIRNLN